MIVQQLEKAALEPGRKVLSASGRGKVKDAAKMLEYTRKQPQQKLDGISRIYCTTIRSQMKYEGRCPFPSGGNNHPQALCASRLGISISTTTDEKQPQLFKGPGELIDLVRHERAKAIAASANSGVASSRDSKRARVADAADPDPTVELPSGDTEMQPVSKSESNAMDQT